MEQKERWNGSWKSMCEAVHLNRETQVWCPHEAAYGYSGIREENEDDTAERERSESR